MLMNGDYRSTRLRPRGEGKITLTFITHTPARGKRTSLSHVLNSLMYWELGCQSGCRVLASYLSAEDC